MGSLTDAVQREELVASLLPTKQHLIPEQLGRAGIPIATHITGPQHMASQKELP